MSVFSPPIQHIVIGDKGVPQVAGTRMKVSQIVIDSSCHGLSPEEIAAKYPGVVNLAQVYAALAYYEDNTRAIEQQIAEEDQLVEQMRATLPESGFAERFRRGGV